MILRIGVWQVLDFWMAKIGQEMIIGQLKSTCKIILSCEKAKFVANCNL